MAHLLAEEDWEVKHPILDSVFRLPRVHRFACVEVELNGPLWHLDLQFTLAEGVSHWRRFIFSTVDQVAATLEAHLGKCRLHVQSTRVDGVKNSYDLSPVHCMKIAEDSTGRLYHVVVLDKKQLVFPDRELSSHELVGHRLIYGRETTRS
jgi:hypothetical protein